MSGHPSSVKAIKDILAQNQLAPLKSLGQNFLIDNNILDKIVNSGELTSGDLVLEIGPGLGALTTRLASRAGRVVAVEFDRGLFGILQGIFAGQSNLSLINADFLQVDLQELIQPTERQDYSCKVIANLPYYITSPLIFKLVESDIRWERLIFLVQKEVAQRICAKPGTKDYGTLTVMLNYYGTTRQIGTVSKNVFYPAPQVDSAVIQITPDWNNFDPELYAAFHLVVQAAFGQRRKTVLNALGNLYEFGGKEKLGDVLAGFGIDPARRGETLEIGEFIRLAKVFRGKKFRGTSDDF
jgi:16S rRNA (adenine1518-N6/adenine1519-N6)-dimethyltransferase